MKKAFVIVLTICMLMQTCIVFSVENYINVESLFENTPVTDSTMVTPISDSVWFDSERILPFNCGYELYDETEFIRNNSMNGQLYLSDDSYEGNFSLCINPVYNDIDKHSLLPVKITNGVIIDKDVTTLSLREYPMVNTIDLFVKPASESEWISFYVCVGDLTGTSYKLLGDVNSDGMYMVGTDLAQGVWNKITLDLTETEFQNESGFINSLCVRANDGSNWLVDNLSSNYIHTETQEISILELSKDNLVVKNNYLEFEKDTENSDIYNIAPVITNLKVDLKNKLTEISIDSTYGEQPESVQYNAISENLFPEDIIENNNSGLWHFSNNDNFYTDSDSHNIFLNGYQDGLENCSYIEIPNTSDSSKRKKLVFIMSSNAYSNSVTISNQDGYSAKFVGLYEHEWHELILPPNTDKIYFSSHGRCYINALKLFDIPNQDTSLSSKFINSSLTEHNKFTDLNYSNMDIQNMSFDGIDNYESITGTNQAVDYTSSSYNYTVVKVVCPYKINTNVTITNGNYTQNVQYGENEYLFSGTTKKQIQLNLNTNYPGILITEIKKYSNYNNVKIDQEYSSYLKGNNTVKISGDANMIYYISPENLKQLCAYDIDKNEVKALADILENGKIVHVSPNGKYALFVSGGKIMVYSYENNSSYIADVTTAFSINDEGVYCGIFKNSRSQYLHSSDSTADLLLDDDWGTYSTYTNADDTIVTRISSSNNGYVTQFYKKQDQVWHLYGTVNEKFSNIVFVDNFAYGNIDDTIYCIDMENLTYSQLQMSGKICSVTDNGRLLVNTTDHMVVYDSVSQEKMLLASECSETAVYNSQSHRLLYIPSDESGVRSFSTLKTDEYVLSLFSFDGGKSWFTYRNDSWIYLANVTNPGYSDFTTYGMTSNEVSSIPSAAFDELYNKFDDIYSLNISMLVHSRTEKYSPKIHSISVITEVDFDNSLYAAKSSFFSKSDYNKVNAIYPIENIPHSTENYYLIALGEEWLYTYKNNKFIRLNVNVSEVLSDMSKNWGYIKQCGISSSELSSIPANALSDLLLNANINNTGFHIINCVKTDADTTKNITVSYKLNAEEKYAFNDNVNLKITFTDGSVKEFGSISENIMQDFFAWIENCYSGVGKAYYCFRTPDRSIFVNYNNIQLIEIS